MGGEKGWSILSLFLPCFLFLARSHHHHHHFCHELFPLWLHVSSCAIPSFSVSFLRTVKMKPLGASTSLVHSFILRIILNSYVKSCCIKVSLLNHLFNSPEWDDRVSSLFTICSYLSSLCNLYDPPQFCLCLILCLPLFQSTNFLFQITYSFEFGVTKTFNILSHTLYSLFINLPNLDFQRFSWLIMQ